MNKISEMVKWHKKCQKLANAYAEQIVRNCPEMAGEYMRLYQQEYDHQKQLILMGVDSAISNFHQPLNEILEKHGMRPDHNDESLKLTDKWVMITIRPEIVISVYEFKSSIEECLKSPKFLEWTFALEQKGETPEEAGVGIHVHILAKIQGYIKGRKDIRCIFESLQKKFKSSICVGKENGPMLIKDTIGLERANNYIRGEKHNKDKEAAVAVDKIWRKQMGLNPLYYSHNNQD